MTVTVSLSPEIPVSVTLTFNDDASDEHIGSSLRAVDQALRNLAEAVAS